MHAWGTYNLLSDPRAKIVVFYTQDGSRGVSNRKGAVQEPPWDPLNGPIAGLVEGNTFLGSHSSIKVSPSYFYAVEGDACMADLQAYLLCRVAQIPGGPLSSMLYKTGAA